MHLGERISDAVLNGPLRADRHEVHDDFGIAGALEDRPPELELFPQGRRVGKVAIVGNGDGAPRVVDGYRLRVLQERGAGSGVAHVADGGIAREPPQLLRWEDIDDVSHASVEAEVLAVARGYAGALLAAVLQSVQAEVGEVGRFSVPVNSEDSTHGSRAGARRPPVLSMLLLTTARKPQCRAHRPAFAGAALRAGCPTGWEPLLRGSRLCGEPPYGRTRPRSRNGRKLVRAMVTVRKLSLKVATFGRSRPAGWLNLPPVFPT